MNKKIEIKQTQTQSKREKHRQSEQHRQQTEQHSIKQYITAH